MEVRTAAAWRGDEIKFLAGSVIFREKGSRRDTRRKIRFEITHARDFERQ